MAFGEIPRWRPRGVWRRRESAEGAMIRARFGLTLAAMLLAVGPSALAQRTPAGLVAGQTVDGELSSNDAQRPSGKYEDVFTVQGRRGSRLDLRLSSEDFDSFLVVSGPQGFTLSNDDEPGTEALDSRLVLEFPTDGAYRVAVTTFRPGDTGAYRLQASAAAAGVPVSVAEPAQPIRIGDRVNGTLAEGDGRLG